MTKETILNATGNELSKLAGEVLQVKKSCRYCWHFDLPSCDYGLGNCKHMRGPGMSDCDKHETCKYYYSKPIPLTWPEAMKWRDWAVKEYGEAFHQAMWDVCCAVSEHGQNTAFSCWLATTAQSEHYIKAACLCKLENDNE